MPASASQSAPVRVLIASYLEPEHVARIRALDARIEVLYEPELLRKPRYAADHHGEPTPRSPAAEARWRELLASAEVLFDFDATHYPDLPELAPRLRWIQASSAGIGQFVASREYDKRMPAVRYTTAAGVHAKPLAEFCIMGMLALGKGLLRALDDQKRKRWERYAGTDLSGRTLGIFGVGAVGTEVARVARAFGMRVLGVKARVAGIDPASLHLDELYPPEQFDRVLARAEYLVLIAPHTPKTAGLLGKREFDLMPRGAILVNIARGALVDETALADALRSGQLGGACLDVFDPEPLPPHSPLWEMPNVIVSPHSGSTSDRENGRLTDLFCENLARYLGGEPLRNLLDTERLY